MRKLPNSQKLTAEVIGLDVHKCFIVYSLLDRRGQEKESGKIPSNRGSLSRLFDEKIGRRRTHIAFEASRSSLWVYRVGAEQLGKDRVHVAQASRIRAIANSQEKNDAMMLGGSPTSRTKAACRSPMFRLMKSSNSESRRVSDTTLSSYGRG